MSIYNFSVLKSKPLKLTIELDGKPTEITAYRVKFHGREIYVEPYDGRLIEGIAKQARRRWGKESPEFGISTTGYEGDLDFNHPYLEGKGLALYKLKGWVAWQEMDGVEKTLGRVKKEGRNYTFIPLSLPNLAETKTQYDKNLESLWPPGKARKQKD